MTKPEHIPTHYEILGLPSPSSLTTVSTRTTIKLAYHRALLAHHPDKSYSAPRNVSYTVDEITLAYRVLSDSTSRASYDRSILARDQKTSRPKDDDSLGGEIVDLDDLVYDDKAGVWYRGCRCGQERGFKVTEKELEKAMEAGEKEVITGCGGCSLWIKVLFEWTGEG